jgi:hypothetical protein
MVTLGTPHWDSSKTSTHEALLVVLTDLRATKIASFDFPGTFRNTLQNKIDKWFDRSVFNFNPISIQTEQRFVQTTF